MYTDTYTVNGPVSGCIARAGRTFTMPVFPIAPRFSRAPHSTATKNTQHQEHCGKKTRTHADTPIPHRTCTCSVRLQGTGIAPVSLELEPWASEIHRPKTVTAGGLYRQSVAGSFSQSSILSGGGTLPFSQG